MQVTRFLVIFSLLIALALKGQDIIRLKTGPIHTAGRRVDLQSVMDQVLVRTGHSLRERRHWIVQFGSYPGPELRQELEHRRFRVLGYVPDFALIVSTTGLPDLQSLDVRWAGLLAPSQKVSPLIASGLYDTFLVSFHLDADVGRGRETVRQAGLELVENSGLLPHQLLASGPPEQLTALAADDDVAYIFPSDRELRLRRPRYRCPGPMAAAGLMADYALEGQGWPKDSGGNVNLGYFFDSLPTKLDANTARSEIERAFTEWERYANVSFTAAQAEAAERSIDILFATGAHGDSYPFTDATALAHTFYPSPPNTESIAGDMHFNDIEEWGAGTDVDLFSVALHEAGHALGLGHSDDPTAVMYPYYKIAAGLASDDIAAIQALYGARGAAMPAPTPTSAPSPPPTPASTPPPSPQPAPISDSTPPSISIVSPGGTIVSAYTNSILIGGTASDNVGVTEVDWSSSTGGSGKASGTTNWSATVPLLVGDNVITLKAYDAAGNSGSRPITVVRH